MPVNIDRKQFQNLGRLEFIAKQAVEGFITGLHKSPFHGFSVEFAEHRQYNTGESTRHLDWKLLARTDKHFVKRYEEETNLRCQILIDNSSSMIFPEGVTPEGSALNKLKFSIYASAAIIELLSHQRDAVGLAVFSESIELFTRTGSSGVHLNYLFHELENLLQKVGEGSGRKSNVSEALHEIAERVHQRSLVVIFSDMMENKQAADQVFPALQHLRHNKHEVVIFHVTDKKHEVGFQYENRPYTFTDLETGEEIKVNPADIRETYIRRMAEFRQELDVRCGQNNIDLVDADISEGFNHVLLQYLIKRQKMY
jgi:uncharacterized protein (DUF58 family)